MARYVTTIRSPRSPHEAFAYMADLRHFADWDPGVRGVTQVGGDGGGPGATFDVVVDAPGGGTTLRYVTTVHDEPRHIRAEARSRLLTSVDTIDVEPIAVDAAADPGGSIVTYDADLRLNGPLRLLDPLLALAFRRIGDRAAAGLITALDGVPIVR